ncbi:hypothetical protein [Intestinibacter bartlettii]|uniref:hypothetical protein n=1 Tax=Intestinibacter bartlettii TaxID=261299 RepID=UPI003AB247BD
MKSKKQIYEETQNMVLKTNTDNYMEYLKTYRQAFNSNITQEEKDDIRKKAYEEYQRKENELYDILTHAYMDYMHDANPIFA